MNAYRIHRRLQAAVQWSTILAAACAGCGKRSGPQSVEILVSGDTQGWITPCGCASNQSGGLSHRASLIASYGDADQVLYLDAGGSASGATEYQRIKLEAILRGLQAMNLAAHNIGGPESALDPEQLAALADKTGVTWLSANLQSKSGDFPAQRVAIFQRGGMRIAVTGVVDPALVKNNAWSTREPVAAILESLGEVKADVRVVLAYFDEDGLRSLAQSLPEVDFVIGGPTGQAMKPATIGPVTVLSATNKGKFLARIQFSRAADQHFRTTSIGPAEVTSELAENVAQVENLKRYYAALAERDFTVSEAGLASNLQGDSSYRIAGSESCAKCHAEDAAAWHASRHSHAWDDLVARQAHVDPFCQQCHTTGVWVRGWVHKRQPDSTLGARGMRKLSRALGGARCQSENQNAVSRGRELHSLPRSRKQSAIRLRQLLAEDSPRIAKAGSGQVAGKHSRKQSHGGR